MKASLPLRLAFGKLAERDRFVLRRRYVDGAIFREIGAELGVTSSRVRELVLRAEKRLAVKLARKPPPSPLPEIPVRIVRTIPVDFSRLRRWRCGGPLHDGPVRRAEPFGTLDEILDALAPYSVQQRATFVDDALRLLDRGRLGERHPAGPGPTS